MWRRNLPTKQKTILGVIPARGGSKGVHRKNVRLLSGKPLIAYSIEAALQSTCLTNFYVSTDDAEISEVASSYGAPVIRRPDGLAQDKTPMLPVLQHAVLEAEKLNGIKYDYVMIIQPTAPKRSSADIDNAFHQIVVEGKESLVSVYKVEDCHPSRMYRVDNGTMVKVMAEPEGSLRQALPDVYHRNGCIYISTRELILGSCKILSDDCIPFIMSEENSVNIDTELDLEYAEFVFQKQSGKRR
tara:strand:- start:3423 stop:4151 length:729 start_codon:yes stop_codon:yes gene_type:complete